VRIRSLSITGEIESAQAAAVAIATAGERVRERDRLMAAAAADHEAFVKVRDGRGFDSECYALALADVPEIPAFRKAVSDFRERLAAANARAERAHVSVAGLTLPDIEATEEEKVRADTTLTALVTRIAGDAQKLRALEAAAGNISKAQERHAASQASFAHIGELSRLAQGQNSLRMSLVDYAVAAYFEQVLEAANLHFSRMSGDRFELRRKVKIEDQRSRSGLEITVYDAHIDREREAQTLSGGEGFLAALALALGLSDVVQAEAGGVKLDAIFIDEGFGHLDDQTLDRALDTLRDLIGNARALGVISHIDAVKQQIPVGFEVTPQLRGSRVDPRLAC
jgi:DNA repair protein SbcC/Rad50